MDRTDFGEIILSKDDLLRLLEMLSSGEPFPMISRLLPNGSYLYIRAEGDKEHQRKL